MFSTKSTLSAEQISKLSSFADTFLAQWESHNIPVQGSIDLINDIFVRVAAFTDEPSMCGRAQDAQMRLMKELEGELGVSLTDRMLLAFDVEGELKTAHLNEVERLIESQEIKPKTLFFNNLVHSKEEYESNWRTTAKNSWLERFF